MYLSTVILGRSDEVQIWVCVCVGGGGGVDKIGERGVGVWVAIQGHTDGALLEYIVHVLRCE